MNKSRSRNKVVSFLYELMRDHLSTSGVQHTVNNSKETGETVFSNGYLADYAKELAENLGQDLTNEDRTAFLGFNEATQEIIDDEVMIARQMTGQFERFFPHLGIRRAFERAMKIEEFIES